MSVRVAIDIGGGFADLAAIDLSTGQMYWSKTYTTPDDLKRCVKEVFKESRLQPSTVEHLLHGQTLVINSILQRTGAKVGLITTSGFRDVLSIQRANRRDIFNLRYHKPKPFVPRSLCYEVSERVSATGEVLTPVDKTQLIHALEDLLAKQVEAIAICYINSYANPANEYETRAIIQEHLSSRKIEKRPHLTISADVCREWREYERTSTTVLNAYVMPVIKRYVHELSQELRAEGIPGTLYMMLSNGGVASFDYAAHRPIETVESGPVAGIVGAVQLASWIGEPNVIALDGGSTTTKASLVHDGKIRYMGDYAIERDDHNPGYPIKVPVVDVVEIGVGGNSLAWIDANADLKVGPRNAGANIGPAAYGRGGTEPTLTDAFIALGIINPEYLLGGALPVQRHLAESAIAKLAERLSISVQQMALGIMRIAMNNAAQLLRLISIQRGFDPRDFCLLTYGGSGPMIAALIARELEIPRVLIPAIPPGNFSAWGLLMSDLKHTTMRTMISRLDRNDVNTIIDKGFRDLEQEILSTFQSENVTESITLARMADVRYYGQEHTIRVNVPEGPLTSVSLEAIQAAFNEEHRKEYGFTLDSAIELVNVVVEGTANVGKPTLQNVTPTSRIGSLTPSSTRKVFWQDSGEVETPIYQRPHLIVGDTITGPAVIEESTTTVVIPPNFKSTVDSFGNLLIELIEGTAQ